MAEALGPALSLSTAATALRTDGDGVEVEVASGRRVRAREVVLATTAGAQAALVAAYSAEAAEILLTVRYVPMVVVAVGLPPGGSPPRLAAPWTGRNGTKRRMAPAERTLNRRVMHTMLGQVHVCHVISGRHVFSRKALR